MRRLKYIIIPLLAISIYSCETTEKIDDFPLRPSKLVANCFFSPDSVWKIQVSESLSVLDNAELSLLNNATVLLFRDSTLLDSIKESNSYGVYTSSLHLPVENVTYSIEVTTPKYKNPAKAEARTPKSIPIEDVTITIRDSMFYRDYYYPDENYLHGQVEGDFGVLIDDPAGAENYYELKIYVYNIYQYWEEDSLTFKTDRYPMSFSTDDPVAEDYNSDDFITSLLFSDQIFNGQLYELSLHFNDWDATYDRYYEFELKSLSREGYLYRKTVQEYENSNGDPFSEPVVIYSNIENGYGIFAGYSLYVLRKNLF